MNEVIEWTPVLPKPSRDLPCIALPFGILQDVCRVLDIAEKWKEVAEAGSKTGFLQNMDLQRISRIHNESSKRKCSPTIVFLEDISKQESVTVGEFLDVLKGTKSFDRPYDRLEEYLSGSIPDIECERSPQSSNLLEDSRSEVYKKCLLIPAPQQYALERKDATDLIWECFTKLEMTGEPFSSSITTVVAEGDPGLGKSQIARQFGYRYLDYFASRRTPVVICTLHAGDRDELYKSYVEIAGHLEVDVKFLEEMDTLDEKFAALIEGIGEKLSKYPDWLIIVDNLMNSRDSEEGKDLYPCIPHSFNTKMNSWGKGKVIITVQLQGIFKPEGSLEVIRQESLQLPMMSAKKLLVEVSGSSGDGKVLEAIVKKLGYNSLALISAAMFKKLKMKDDPSYTWEQYRRDFQPAFNIQQDRKLYKQTSVAASLCLALEKVASEEVVQLAFVAIAFVEYKSVPQDLIVEFVKAKVGRQRHISDAEVKIKIGELTNYPLISSTMSCSSPSSNERNINLYHVHQFTHKVLSDDMLKQWSSNSSLQSFLFPLLQATVSSEEQVKHARELRYFVPHMYALGKKAMEIYEKVGAAESSEGVNEWHYMPEVLYKATDHSSLSLENTSTQLMFLNKCIEMAESDEIPGISMQRRVRYRCLKVDRLEISGKADEAIKFGFESLELAKKVHSSEENPKLIADAVLCLRMRPIYKEGIQTYEENWEYVVEGYGKDSEEYVALLFNYADICKRVDRFKARACLEEALKIVRGKDNPQLLLSALSYYARFLLSSYSSADIVEALDIARECMAILEMEIGKKSRSYINESLTLGRALMTNGKPREASEHLEPILRQVQKAELAGQEFNYCYILTRSYWMSSQIDKCRSTLKRCLELLQKNELDVDWYTAKSLHLASLLLPFVDRFMFKPCAWICSCIRKLQA